jgi:hypothetical protein
MEHPFRTPKILISVILLSSLVSCSTRSQEDLKTEVLSTTDRYIQAWADKDIRAFEAIFHTGPELTIYEVRKIFNGWDAWETRLTSSFATVENVEVFFRNSVVHLNQDGKTAWLSTIEDATWLDGGEPREVQDMRVTWALVKKGDQWKIMQAHWSVP